MDDGLDARVDEEALVFVHVFVHVFMHVFVHVEDSAALVDGAHRGVFEQGPRYD